MEKFTLTLIKLEALITSVRQGDLIKKDPIKTIFCDLPNFSFAGGL